MKITTIAEALSLVPEFWPLVPGVDKWREGDEYFSRHEGWLFVHHMSYKILCEIGAIVRHEAARRPIPQSVREVEAFWILFKELRFEYYPSSQVKVFSARSQDNGVLICTDCAWGLFPTDITKLGGVEKINQTLIEGHGALWRWVAEMRGSQ